MPFGIGSKGDYTASLNNSRQFFQHATGKKRIHNQSMTIDVGDSISSGTGRNAPYMPMIKTTMNRNKFSVEGITPMRSTR